MPKRRWLLYLVITAVAVLYVANAFTVYTIPNNDDATDGITLVVKQGPSMPFFDSPDAFCIRKFNNSNRLCREQALDLIVFAKYYFELPYLKWAYLISTDGRRFP